MALEFDVLELEPADWHKPWLSRARQIRRNVGTMRTIGLNNGALNETIRKYGLTENEGARNWLGWITDLKGLTRLTLNVGEKARCLC